jgi:D-glycero-alpha-D-manno-heptose-7-phosphate kinase
MIITRTPFRISFFGGGTDYPHWYKEHNGTVLSTTINKYCYISCRYLPPFFPYKYLIRYFNREEVKNVSQINHPSVRECLKYLKINKGIEMVHTSDIPARSGVGSSSSFTVGFLNALTALEGKMITKRSLARDAIYVEQELLKENVGSQDQVAAAFGGLNKIEFGGDLNFYVQPLTISQENLKLFQDHLMLFFTGLSRTASNIAKEQIESIPIRKRELRIMDELVDEAISILSGDYNNIIEIGNLLNETWEIKKHLTKLISNNTIEEIYNIAMNAGALGGKLLGAGGGGFILFFVSPEHQLSVKERLKDFLYVPFRFENLGSQVVMYATE